ncbi:MAG TPA: hypothetical protein VF485_07045 [Sphingomonas sp.]
MQKFLFAAAMAAAFPTCAFAGDRINNAAVVSLLQAGLGDEAVIAKINASDVDFDLSTDQMIALKQKGVSGPVIAAMLKRATPGVAAPSLDSIDPMIPHPAGVYMVQSWDGLTRMQRLDPTVSTQAKTGGILGYALTYGIASMSVKAAIQNEAARYSAKVPTPTFYFFFDEANSQPSQTTSWAAGTAATVTAPSEFTLVELTPKKGRREARVGSVNIGGAKTGVMDKDRLSFDYEMIRPGVYKVTPKQPLKAGQYGFIYSLTGGAGGGALTARIFDFGVQ